MPDTNKGKVVGINGNMVTVEFDQRVMQNEVAYVVAKGERLKCEVIRVRGNNADMQIFEDAKGLKIGDEVEFTEQLLSVELGPGLLTRVYDGLQNPLNDIAEKAGFFLKRGLYMDPLDREAKWAFTPLIEAGATVKAGSYLGKVPEGLFEHYICAPFGLQGEWTVTEVAAAGDYTVEDVVAQLKNERGDTRQCKMYQNWPVKVPITSYAEKLLPREPLITQMRERYSRRHEQAQESGPVLDESDDRHADEHHQRHAERDDDMAGGGEAVRDHPEQVREQDEHEQREDEREVGAPGAADVVAQHVGDEFVGELRHRLPSARHHRSAADAGGQENRRQRDADEHPQRGIGERDIQIADVDRDQIVDFELFERGVHPLFVAGFGRQTHPRL